MEKNFSKILSKLNFRGDKVVLGVTIVLSLISFIVVYSSTGVVWGHLKHFLVCFVAMAFFYHVNYVKASVFAPFLLILALALLFWTLLSGGEANRGVSIGGIDIQTFYLIGFLIVYVISHFLARQLNKGIELTPRASWILIGIILFFCAGIAYTNMSTSIILFLTSVVVLFLGKVRPKYILTLFAVVIIGVAGLWVTGIGRAETFKGRIHYYLTQDNTDHYGDQMILAKAAIARSGITPTGPGQGVIKKSLPEKETDYVYATLFEETGLIIGLPVLFLYLVLYTRAYRIAQKCKGTFGMLLAMGIGFWFTCQGLVHIAVNTELIPATGQTLPFISRGGASLLFSGIMIGVLLNISKENNLEAIEDNIEK